MKHYPYAYSALGLLYYPVQQAIFYVRFGRLNAVVSPTDPLLALVGVLAVGTLVYFLNTAKSGMGRTLYTVVFLLLGVPVSLIGSIGGGLLGPLGAVVFGLVPVFVLLLLTKGILLLLKR